MITSINEFKKINENTSGVFAPNEVHDSLHLVKTEIGTNPGYFFFANDEDINAFNTRWYSKDYAGAFNMLASAHDLDIHDYATLKKFIDGENSNDTGAVAAPTKLERGTDEYDNKLYDLLEELRGVTAKYAKFVSTQDIDNVLENAKYKL